jgi:hypothetical protein
LEPGFAASGHLRDGFYAVVCYLWDSLSQFMLLVSCL